MGRLELYCQAFHRPDDHYKVSVQASCNGPDWIGLERYFTIIEETLPFRLISRRDYADLLWQHFRGPIVEIPHNACVLIDHLNRKPNFFHWFLDALPRIFAAEAYEQLSGQPSFFVLPAFLLPWQRESLNLLGLACERLIQIPSGSTAQAFRLERLISTFSHRHIRHSPTGHFDAFSPAAIQTLCDRLARGAGSPAPGVWGSRRLYISRGSAGFRRVKNEDTVMEILSAHGFQRVCLEGLSVRDQIHLFHNASHVIAPHGGALTNLIHINANCQVLEVFQSGHGLRPDFFQLTALKGATYSFYTAPSLNSRHDIEIPANVLHTFLEASL
ncbi:MAG: glycosyltransferase family 61 protein [Cyanobacteriota bacterium]